MQAFLGIAQSRISANTVCCVDPIQRGRYLTLETGIGERQLMFDGGEEFLHWLKRSSLVVCIRYPWFGAVMAFKPVTFRQHSSKHGPHHKVSLEKGCGTSAMDGILRTSWLSANTPGTFLKYSI